MIIIYISILIFALRNVVFIIGSFIERRNNKEYGKRDFVQSVSIIVPARNEQDNIESCIRSISANNYPQDKFEIIAVNDRSDDETLNILHRLALEIPNLRIITIENYKSKQHLKGKPNAIHNGIEQSRYDIIMLTDGDCVVGTNWIRSIIKHFEKKEVGLLSSFTNISGRRIFDKIQAVEWMYMHTMASAGIGLHQPLGCYGNNMSFRKKDYYDVGGYASIKFSVTEDLALQQAIFAKGSKLVYLTDSDAVIDTKPCNNLKEYFKQHHRWAVGGLKLGWRAAVYVIASTSLWAGIIASLITGSYLLTAGVILCRVILDYLLILPSITILKKYNLHLWVFVSVVFFIVAEPIIPCLILNKKIEWKGQVFNS